MFWALFVSSSSTENKHFEKVLENPSEAPKQLREILNKLSKDLTDFARDICVEHNIDPNVKIVPTLIHYLEHEVMTRYVGGWGIDIETIVKERMEKKKVYIHAWYDPEKRTIFIYIDLPEDMFCISLAHELIHHCQYTCHSEKCKNVCEYWLNIDEAREINESIHYNLRPHEIEAYTKDEEFCRRIKENKRFNEVYKKYNDAFQEVKEIMTFLTVIYSDL